MIMHEVESSNVKAIGYHQGEKTLKIVFKNKKEYLYHDVEIEIFDELLKTESIGKFLSQNVYKNYSYSMVVTEENKKKQEKTKKEEKNNINELNKMGENLTLVDNEMSEMMSILKKYGKKE